MPVLSDERSDGGGEPAKSHYSMEKKQQVENLAQVNEYDSFDGLRLGDKGEEKQKKKTRKKKGSQPPRSRVLSEEDSKEAAEIPKKRKKSGKI